MLHAVTNLFLATRSNECTLFVTVWAMTASPQPKSATTWDVGLQKEGKNILILLFIGSKIIVITFLCNKVTC